MTEKLRKIDEEKFDGMMSFSKIVDAIVNNEIDQ